MRRGTVVALVLAATVVTIYDMRASDDLDSRLSLKEVASVYVMVEGLSDDLTRAGLSTETLKTDVEFRLRAFGIRVATEEERFRMLGMPYLYLHVTGIRDQKQSGRSHGYYAAISLEFKQSVHMDRVPESECVAATWSVGGVVGGQPIDVIRRSVRDYADKFAWAYVGVNYKS